MGVSKSEWDQLYLVGATPEIVSGVEPGGSSNAILCASDDDLFIERISYPDETYDKYSYNEFKQITRHRDRLGNL